MNLFKYVSAMKELDSTVALIGILLLCFFLVTIIIRMFLGMRRGFWRQIVCTITTILSMIISVIVASSLSEGIIGGYDTPAIEDLIEKVEGVVPGIGEFLRKLLLTIDPDVFESIFLLPATLILIPIMATVIFLLLNALFKIVRLIVIKVMGLKKANNNGERLGGALLAAVEAIIWVMMIALPINGIIGLVDRAYDEAVRSGYTEDNEELERIHDEYLSAFTDNPAFTFINSVGGNAISNSIATVEINDSKVNIRDEVVDITVVIMSEATVLNDSDIAGLTAEEKEAIDNIIDAVCNSPYLTHVVAGAFRSAGSILNLDIIYYEEGSDFAEIIDSIIIYFESITDETLRSDLCTMKELVYAVSDSGAIYTLREGQSDLWTVLQDQRKNGDDTITRLIDILQSNERTSGLVKTFTEVLISSLASEIKMPDGSVVTVTYDDLKDSMSEVLNVKQQPGQSHDEYMENLSDTLNETFTEHGITLEKEIVDSIAEYIDTEYSGNEEFTDEEFNDVLLHYYDAYLEYLDTGNIPDDLPDNIPDFNN